MVNLIKEINNKGIKSVADKPLNTQAYSQLVIGEWITSWLVLGLERLFLVVWLAKIPIWIYMSLVLREFLK